jgi:ATP-dependent DNA ligase
VDPLRRADLPDAVRRIGASMCRELLAKPYTERRRALQGLQLNGPHWKTPANYIGDGEHIRAIRLEGLVAKRLDSPYEAGQRTGAWVKIKNHRTGVYRIGGWIPDQEGRIEALLVGKPASAGMLQYVGAVELGPLNMLRHALDRLATKNSPFHAFQSRSARRVIPLMNVTVRSIDTDGTWLREPTLISAQSMSTVRQ